MTIKEEIFKVIDYWNGQADSYDKQYETAEYVDYPANSIRLKIILDILGRRAPKTLLDIGTGSCVPLIEFLKLGLDAEGFDYAVKMVEYGKKKLEEEKYPNSKVFQASLEDIETLPGKTYDCIVSLGVFPHNEDDNLALQNIRKLLIPKGFALIEFRNELFSLFTLNRHSIQFFNDYFNGSHLTGEQQELLKQAISERFNLDKDSSDQSVRKQQYDTIRARFHNPLTLANLFDANGFKFRRSHWYHYHALPPYFESNDKKTFREASLKLEDPDDWKGYFMCSAFVAEVDKIN